MSTPEATADARRVTPTRIGARYDVHEVLGRGGMAVVYRATDIVDGREVALKQLTSPERPRDAEAVAALFEREFHTLAELSHPRIIEVYDYGLAPEGAYYTMELLDGGDLRERSPIPWREACALAYEICSSLALIHSRRLVHRDVSPRNVRCTKDGRAKLIDFGALVPMGQRGLVVGTPAFVSPEVVHGAALDARADLFSFGATLYFALTGRHAYPARAFAELRDVWLTEPVPPSKLVSDVPAALDALVSSLLDLEPSRRPQTAFDVMHRLAAIANLARVEPESVSRSYLAAPRVVGREGALKALRAHLERASRGRGRSLLLAGGPGLGRSRMLDAFGLDAKTRGATLLRAGAKTSGGGHFALAQALAEALVRTLPDDAVAAASSEGVREILFEAEPSQVGTTELRRPRLVELKDGSKGSRALQEALTSWFLRIARDRLLAFALDDVDRVDAPSGALIAAMVSRASEHRLLLVATAGVAENRDPESLLGVLERRSTTLTLRPLTLGETEDLLKSVFGDVPGIAVVSAGIHRISSGNPRACMDLAQHLVDGGVVRYEAGTWTLPSRLDPTDLPGSTEAAIRTRIENLSPLSRFIAEAQALALSGSFTRQSYALLCPNEPPGRVDQAVTELLSQQVLTSDGRIYGLSHEGWASSLLDPLSEATKLERHRALVRVYESTPGLGIVHHLLGAGAHAEALDRLGKLLSQVDGFALYELTQLPTMVMATILEDALRTSVSLGRHPREASELRRWVTSFSTASDEGFHYRCAPPWLAQLEHDSGLEHWRKLADVVDPSERRARALGAAYEQYGSKPEAERIYSPEEAIKGLVQYVVFSIAVGSRTHDPALLKSLPPLLEPFVPLSPAVEAIWNNALATDDHTCTGRPEAAVERWLGVLTRIEGFTEAELPYVGAIRRAIEAGIGSASAYLGLASADEWAERIEQDTLHEINALYLRKAIRLELGDWAGAERFGRQAEVLGLRAHARQMFASAYTLEVTAYAMARDLTGLKHVMDRIEPLAARSPGWLVYHLLAEGHFRLICGENERALELFERALALSIPVPDDPARLVAIFPQIAAGRAEALIELGRVTEARDVTERALALCAEHDIVVLSHPVARALALAEARAGDHAGGAARLEALIEHQAALGVIGMHLGATYEARTRVAIWAQDLPAIGHFGRLTAHEYRHGQGSPLGARYQRLLDESRTAGGKSLPKLPQLEATRVEDDGEGGESVTSFVTRMLAGAETTGQRAARALRLLCAGTPCEAHLYLAGEAGLSLVASQEAGGVPGGLREYVTDYLSRELGSAIDETAMVTTPALHLSTIPAAFQDARGRRYTPICLAASVDGAIRYAGVAMLVDAAARDCQIHAGLAAALAAHFMEVGDTLGIAVEG